METSWQSANLSFWFITGLVVVSAAFAALSRSIIRSAFSLFFTLTGIAGYYVLLGSDFIAITQVIIYVGGILVLVMFGVLLTNRSVEPLELRGRRWRLAAPAAGAALLLLIAFGIVLGGPWEVAANLSEPPQSLRLLGSLLLSRYLLPLEISGMTLLLCLIGAAYLVRRRER